MRWRAAARILVLGMLTTLAMAVVYRSTSRPTPVEIGKRAYDSGAWAEAERAARERLATHPEDISALKLYARSAARLGRHGGAEAVYRRLGTGRMDAEDLFLLGSGLLRGGRAGPGLAALGAAEELDPAHPETLAELARYHTSNRMPLEAFDEAERLSRLPGWGARGGLLLGLARRELSDPVAAARSFRDALDRDPELRGSDFPASEVRKLLARSLLELRRPAEARDQLGRLPGDGREVQWLLSRAFLQEGRLGDARSALARSDRFGEDDPTRPDPAPYVGEKRCAECHAARWKQQQSSRHARTFRRAADLDDAEWPRTPLADADEPAVEHTVRREGDGVRIETRLRDRRFGAMIEFALGSGHRGTSFLSRDESGGCRELRISRYPGGAWGRTSEHPARPPEDEGYLGRPLDPDAARKCLHCHVTDALAISRHDSPRADDRGIGCERCHGPGGNHLLAAEAGFPDPAIGRPRLASPAKILALCGQCHESAAAGPRPEAALARFQVPALMRSRCYTESGSMSCVTCHDPHVDAESDVSFYDNRCKSCHDRPRPGPRIAKGIPGASTICPVSPSSKCTDCHMKKVKISDIVFSNHLIQR